MSEKGRDWLKELHEVDKGHLEQRQGAEQLGMSERGFRKLLKRFPQKKDGAVLRGLRGRRSKRGLKLETTASALEAVKLHYGDFGPTLAAEYLEKDLKIKLSRARCGRCMYGGCGAVAGASWCRGTPAFMGGWKNAGRPRCI